MRILSVSYNSLPKKKRPSSIPHVFRILWSRWFCSYRKPWPNQTWFSWQHNRFISGGAFFLCMLGELLQTHPWALTIHLPERRLLPVPHARVGSAAPCINFPALRTLILPVRAWQDGWTDGLPSHVGIYRREPSLVLGFNEGLGSIILKKWETSISQTLHVLRRGVNYQPTAQNIARKLRGGMKAVGFRGSNENNGSLVVSQVELIK